MGFSFLQLGDVDGFDEFGNPTGNVPVQDRMAVLGWGKSWESISQIKLSFGGAIKVLEEQLGDTKGRAILMDVGVHGDITKGFLRNMQAGLALQNMSSGMVFVKEKTPLPKLLKVAFAVPLFSNIVTLTSDYTKELSGKGSVNMGMEYGAWEILALRMGYKADGSFGKGLVYGLGIKRGAWRVDYAMVPFNELGTTHRMSVGYRFGKALKKQKVEKLLDEAYDMALVNFAQGSYISSYQRASKVVQMAPWHTPAKALLKRMDTELSQIEQEQASSLQSGTCQVTNEKGYRFI